MSDETSSSGTLVAIAAAALIAGVALYEGLKDAPTKTAAEAKADGAKLDYNVLATAVDGVKVYVAPLADGGYVKLDKSPCARRPTGVKATDCLAIEVDGGTRDQGDENTMQAGWWVGGGCVPTACVVLAGEAPEVGP